MSKNTDNKQSRWKLPLFNIYEFNKNKTKYCLIIPVMNEGDRFLYQLKKLNKYVKLIDIIIADWGSTDGSTKKTLLRKLGVRTLITKKSPGRLGAQYRMAFAYALKQGYEGVITMDGNGKDGPDSIPLFIEALEEGYDYIQGSRYIKGGKAINTPTERYIGTRYLLSPILSLGAGKWYTDTSNGYRALSKKFLIHKDVEIFRDIFDGYEILFYETVRANQLGLKTKEIPVIRRYPKGKVPTKIIGIRKNLEIIITAIKASLGIYNP